MYPYMGYVCVCVCVYKYIQVGGAAAPPGGMRKTVCVGGMQSCCSSVAAVGARMPPIHAPELLQLCCSCGGSHAPHTCTQGACVREYNNSDKAAGIGAKILTKLGEFK